jgi:hypothetical protein
VSNTALHLPPGACRHSTHSGRESKAHSLNIQAKTRLEDNDENDEDDGEDDSEDDESPELKKAMAKKAWLEEKLAERKFVVAAQILRAELRDLTENTNLEYVDDDCVEEVDDGADWWRVLTQRIEAWRDGVEQAEGSGKRKRSRADHQEEKQSADDDKDEEEMKQPSPQSGPNL